MGKGLPATEPLLLLLLPTALPVDKGLQAGRLLPVDKGLQAGRPLPVDKGPRAGRVARRVPVLTDRLQQPPLPLLPRLNADPLWVVLLRPLRLLGRRSRRKTNEERTLCLPKANDDLARRPPMIRSPSLLPPGGSKGAALLPADGGENKDKRDPGASPMMNLTRGEFVSLTT